MQPSTLSNQMAEASALFFKVPGSVACKLLIMRLISFKIIFLRWIQNKIYLFKLINSIIFLENYTLAAELWKKKKGKKKEK